MSAPAVSVAARQSRRVKVAGTLGPHTCRARCYARRPSHGERRRGPTETVFSPPCVVSRLLALFDPDAARILARDLFTRGASGHGPRRLESAAEGRGCLRGRPRRRPCRSPGRGARVVERNCVVERRRLPALFDLRGGREFERTEAVLSRRQNGRVAGTRFVGGAKSQARRTGRTFGGRKSKAGEV